MLLKNFRKDRGSKMWFIFIVSCVAVALVTGMVLWVINLILLSIKKKNMEFEQEKEKKTDEE